MPSILPQEHVFEMKHTFVEVNLIASDGSQLNGLHFRKDEPKGVVLYFHGNAGDLQGWGQVTEPFIELGYSVIIMDYRGYGKSTGKRSQELLYDDAELWFNYTKQYYKESEITVFGRSLGTTFATYVSSTSNPKKLILESPFYSVEDVAKSRFAFLPVSYLLHYKFPTNKYIDKVTCPIIIYHGTKDQVISYEQGKKLYDSFMASYGKNFRTFKHGAFHGTLTGIMFILPVIATGALFEQKSFKYVMVNAGYWVVTIALMGGVICQFS